MTGDFADHLQAIYLLSKRLSAPFTTPLTDLEQTCDITDDCI